MNSSNNTSTEDLSSDENSLILYDRVSFLSTYRPLQDWLLPDSIIYYMTKNPLTPKSYQKCLQTCKHFFIQNPILLVPHLSLRFKNDEWHAFGNSKCFDFFRSSNKIWVTNFFEILNFVSTDHCALSSITPKIYQCFIKRLKLWDQNIFFKDLQFFAFKCESIFLIRITVFMDDGSVVTLERIFEAFPKVKTFHYICDNSANNNNITTKLVQNLLKIPHFITLSDFLLVDIPENFDIVIFYEYIKKNNKTKIFLNFCDEISEGYKNRLQTMVNEILSTDNRTYRVPYIFFPGINGAYKLFDLYAIKN